MRPVSMVLTINTCERPSPLTACIQWSMTQEVLDGGSLFSETMPGHRRLEQFAISYSLRRYQWRTLAVLNTVGLYRRLCTVFGYTYLTTFLTSGLSGRYRRISDHRWLRRCAYTKSPILDAHARPQMSHWKSALLGVNLYDFRRLFFASIILDPTGFKLLTVHCAVVELSSRQLNWLTPKNS